MTDFGEPKENLQRIDHVIGHIEGESILEVIQTEGPKTRIKVQKAISADSPAEYKTGDRVEIIEWNLEAALQGQQVDPKELIKSKPRGTIVKSVRITPPVSNYENAKWYELEIDLDD